MVTFQSLVGAMRTSEEIAVLMVNVVFQSLVGAMRTSSPVSVVTAWSCFNPS